MIRIIDGKPYLDQVKELIQEYTQWLGRDLSFQNLDKELADIAEKYTAPNGELLVAIDDNDVVLGIHCFLGRCDDINQSLVGSLLELLTGIFVLVNCTKDCYYLFLRWKRYWSAHRCSVLLYSFDNFLCRCIY